jgi:RNA polymerase sigma factor (sigma-70 family)
MTPILTTLDSNDSELTMRAVAGHRDAFGQIVSRYQSLVCSLAYSATGNLSQSEDLAQETFIAAWRGLRTLREPEKLRSWLCSIARNIIADAMRNRTQEPANAAQPLEAAADMPSLESIPVDRAISNEEQAILWQSLEHIPQIYREPLILFYREGQSIESVAQELELSEETVKQRLSRGRKLLKMEVESFVETALRHSAPGRQFTATVLAGLPVLSLSTSASAVGMASAKGSAMAKAGSWAGFIAGMLTPILGALGGFLCMAGIIKSARSAREKALWQKAVAAELAILAAGMTGAFRFHDERISSMIIYATIIAMMAIGLLGSRLCKKIRAEEGIVKSPADRLPFGGLDSKGFKWNVYGYLLGIVFGHPFAFLTITAASAHDLASSFIILAILAAAFILVRRIFLHKPHQVLHTMCIIETAYFALLMIAIHFRWEKWTGNPAWWSSKDALQLVILGFLLFAFFPIALLIKRKR